MKKKVIEASEAVAITFLTPNMTGNAIGGMGNNTSNLIGVGLFVFSLLTIFLVNKSK